MHQIEPFYFWRDYYRAEEDELSPFYGNIYSEFEYSNSVNNFLIHPQWDSIESESLYLKLLFVDYEIGYAIIEFIGDWNDGVNNDIEKLFENCINLLIDKGVDKFILIGDHVFNFYAGDTSYYDEIIQFIVNGWVCCVNFPENVENEMKQNSIFEYFTLIQKMYEELESLSPDDFFEDINKRVLSNH